MQTVRPGINAKGARLERGVRRTIQSDQVGEIAVLVELQRRNEGTCVSCATVNALRHFGVEVNVDTVIKNLRVQRFHGRDGSFLRKAAEFLRRDCGMSVVVSRPPHMVRTRVAAALETAYRFEAVLMQDYVGLIWRKETLTESHAVVLYRVIWQNGEPYFVCYDSNKSHARGHWVYKVEDYVWWTPETEEADPDVDVEPIPTGRVGYFVRPSSVRRLACLIPGHNPFRARTQQRKPTESFGAILTPEG